MTKELTEETKLKVKLATATSVIVSVIGTTVWLTGLLMGLHFKNQSEHTRMIIQLSDLTEKSHDWITKDQLETTFAFVIAEAHRGMTNITIREMELRREIRRHLNPPIYSPRDERQLQ